MNLYIECVDVCLYMCNDLDAGSWGLLLVMSGVWRFLVGVLYIRLQDGISVWQYYASYTGGHEII